MLSPNAKAARQVANGIHSVSDGDIKTTIRHVAEDSKDAIDHVADAATDAGIKVRGVVDRTVSNVTSTRDNLKTEIQTNPLRSGLIAVGIGFILGALLTRR